MDNSTQSAEMNEPTVVKFNGPWSPHDESVKCITVRDSFGGYVADVVTEGDEIPEMWTNARLIAAAADMLAALWTRTRAVIAKATGQV